jgi:hypothetical protein
MCDRRTNDNVVSEACGRDTVVVQKQRGLCTSLVDLLAMLSVRLEPRGSH